MRQSKRLGRVGGPLHNGKPNNRVSKSRPTAPLRRSSRLQEAARVEVPKHETDHQLPSPSPTPSQKRSQEKNGEPDLSPESSRHVKTPTERSRATSNSSEQATELQYNPIAHWIKTDRWPKAFAVRTAPSQELIGKRKSISTDSSDWEDRLAELGIYMRASESRPMPSQDLCSSLLAGDSTPRQYPCYPPWQVSNVQARVQHLNDGRLQRDVTPWVVPSAENLYFSGTITLDYLGEEIQAEWTRCLTLESTPKPDYVAGLLREAFTWEELNKLENYASPERPWLFTPNLCFPFLICEAKTGREGLERANRQNIHSASIAVRAIVELYKAAFGTTSPDRLDEIYDRILAFSVSHNNKQVNLYGHYAVSIAGSDKELEFYRYDIAEFSLDIYGGAERYKAYNFVLNVYERFAPAHRKRIADAVAFLPDLAQRTRHSFAETEFALERVNSVQFTEDAMSVNDVLFQTSTRPVSDSHGQQELVRLINELEMEKRKKRELAKLLAKALRQIE